MTLPEVSGESGLREDLVVRFVSTVDTPHGPADTTRQVALAKVVKAQIVVGTPTSAIEATARELNTLRDNEFHLRAHTLARLCTRPGEAPVRQ